jgi:hypothetical protein
VKHVNAAALARTYRPTGSGRYLSAARRRQAVRRVPCPAVNGCLSILGLGLSPRFALPCHARKCATRVFRIGGVFWYVYGRSFLPSSAPVRERKLPSCIAPQFLRPYPMHYLEGFKSWIFIYLAGHPCRFEYF